MSAIAYCVWWSARIDIAQPIFPMQQHQANVCLHNIYVTPLCTNSQSTKYVHTQSALYIRIFHELIANEKFIQYKLFMALWFALRHNENMQ